MRILSHRGYWKSSDEKNSPAAFERSFEFGFGTETDLRDCLGRLKVSHDPPQADALAAETLFQLYRSADRDLPLALNIKSDGLQRLLPPLLAEYSITNYFLFDMAVPDAIAWLRLGLPTFTRQSEVEREPAFYDQAAGVWLDGFFGDWWTSEIISRHLKADKQVCLVSPELHGRESQEAWERLAAAPFRGDPRLMLCTDRPESAKEFFGG
ncbi:MAG: hypothetical protein K8U03_26400 [Planctomycetia bacterium]|nr:hypothetical protein [Planctomycetia bacterium]